MPYIKAKWPLLLTLALLLALGAGAGILRWQAAQMAATPLPVSHEADKRERDAPGAAQSGGESAELQSLEDYWNTRVTYPTGQFNGAWLLNAASQDKQVAERVPAGQVIYRRTANSPLALDPTSWTALGPQPLQSTGCTGCYQYGHVAGRVNWIVVDPVSNNVAYLAAVGGGVWKTTTCCTAATTWAPVMDDPLISTTSIDNIALDPNNHNTVYAGTGDLNFGSFSMGSAGLLKSTDAGTTWTIKGANVFAPIYPQPPGVYPQYNAIGKVGVNPRNSNNIVAGTKTGVFFSYDAGDTWSGPCLPDAFPTQRQDVTGLLMRDTGSSTDLYVAVGARGYSTTVQVNLAENGANGIYKTTVPASGCPASWTLTTTPGNGWPTGTGSGIPVYQAGGDTLGRVDMAFAPSTTGPGSGNVTIYAIVQAIVTNRGGVLGVWKTTDGGTTWSQTATSASFSGCDTAGAQSWYNQNITVDPNNANTVYADAIDIFRSTNGGTSFTDLTCGYAGGTTVHVDQHALAYVPGSSSVLMTGSDGGSYVTLNADAASPTFNRLNDSLNTIEFYSGDITANFATSSAPGINAGAQDNGSAVYVWPSNAVGPALWQLRKGGDGMYARIEPVLGQRWYQESQNGNLAVSTTGAYGGQISATGGWGADSPRVSFVFPYEIYKYDCPATGCTHMVAGSYRVWETILGAIPASSWYANSPDLTKNTLADRSFINQLSYAVSISTTAIVGTNDGNVQYGFNLGQGTANTATWVNVTGGNSVLPNRPILDVATDPVNPLVGYAAVGGFDENTPGTPGHLYQVTCTANCATFTWANKSGNLPNIPIDSVLANPLFPQQVFLGSDWGLYYTNDITAGSPTWFRFQTGMPNVMIWDMAIDRGFTTLAVFTRGRGAYAWPLPSGPFGASPTPTATGTPPTATRTVTPGPTNTATRTVTVPAPSATATVTPGGGGTATPTPCSGPQVFQGSIDTSDPSHVDYLDIQGPPSTCAVSQSCPGQVPDPGPFHYDTYTFTNNSSSTVCITVNLDGTNCGGASAGVAAAAYLTSFDPNNLCANYLADTGGTPSTGPTDFSFNVPAGATFVVDVEEYTGNTGCVGYTLSVIGLTCPPNGTPTATPPAPPTNTVTPGAATSTVTATPQPTTCAISFNDVPVGSTFYDYIRCLACRGIVGGYPCGGPGEPCPGNYYRPNNNVTRGQVSKIVSESAGFNDVVPSTQQTFEDVPPGSTFALWIERLSVRGIIGGYPCGGPFEPCVSPTNRPYFRPNNNVTRGQLSKITSGAAGWTETPTGQTFEDVAVGSTFYVYIERMAARGIITGYPCGGPFEPCVAPANRPYFRPNNNATRGQMAKIAASAFFPNCQTPTRRR